MSFLYLFAKSAKDKEYKREVVNPTIEEILGGKLDQEISTTVNGRTPGSHGRADGILKIGGKVVTQFWWINDDDDDYHCLHLCFAGISNNFALEAFHRALKIKEKELVSLLDNEHSQPSLFYPLPVYVPWLIGGLVIIIAGIIIAILWRKRKIT